MLLGRGAVPKFGQKNALPREDATEMLEGMVAVLRTASRVGLRIVLRDRPEGRAEQRVGNRVEDRGEDIFLDLVHHHPGVTIYMEKRLTNQSY